MAFALPVLFAADKDSKTSEDSRLGPPVDLNKSYFPFKPPKTKEAWEARRKELREQLQVALGLWPMPEKMPLKPVVHGKIDREGYTIEKVFFASMPGHYVSGNLYRPLASRERKRPEKLPGVLFAHGHWNNGRLFEAPDAEVEASLKSGGEKTKEGARYPLQALPAQLARMGCIVFVYDMVGVADSKAIEHAKGFADADAELHQQSAMGLQTWNSIRALDFLTSLPDVDAKRIGMTGASGGGTQTFILCALDDRPAVAFPAVMVSTAMQGGCVCENCSYLRQDTGNVEIAALFAPKPLGMTGANDWTREIETKGLPELKALYKLYGAEDKVMAKCFPEYGHNYNQVSREVMYNWFNKHLSLGQKELVTEQPFEPVPPKELSVYDQEHPRPKDELSADALRKQWAAASEKQIETLRPKDAEGLKGFQRVVGTALRVMVHDCLPKADQIESAELEPFGKQGLFTKKIVLSRKASNEQVAAELQYREGFDTVVVCAQSGETEDLWQIPLNNAKVAILRVHPLLGGKSGDATHTRVDANFAGYTFGYNRPLLANRVHDILTAVAYVKSLKEVKRIHLVGSGVAGPWALVARAVCGDAVDRCAVDVDGFRFDKVTKTTDEMMLPGALKYGGLPAFAALCAPHELYLYNHKGTGMGQWLKPAYDAAKASDHLKMDAEKIEADKVIEWLLR
jgi:dienelactone hydrolase